MKAIVQREYGGPEVLVEADRDIPLPSERQVRVRVIAAGVDAGVAHILEGRPFPVRMALPIRGERVLGSDFSGIVDAVGPGVSGIEVGDAVFGEAEFGAGCGSLGEYALARKDRIAPKPDALTFGEASALAVSGVTALQAVRSAGVKSGQRVLVLGAAGGVGHFAVQVALASGAHVTGACSAPKIELVQSLGADEVVDYTTSDPLTLGPFDAIIDIAGHRTLRSLRRALTPTGALILVGSEPEGVPMGGLGRSFRAMLLNPFTRQRLAMLISQVTEDALQELSGLVARGDLRPVVHRELPLSQAAEAIRGLGRGRGTAKTVVRVQPEP